MTLVLRVWELVKHSGWIMDWYCLLLMIQDDGGWIIGKLIDGGRMVGGRYSWCDGLCWSVGWVYVMIFCFVGMCLNNLDIK